VAFNLLISICAYFLAVAALARLPLLVTGSHIITLAISLFDLHQIVCIFIIDICQLMWLPGCMASSARYVKPVETSLEVSALTLVSAY